MIEFDYMEYSSDANAQSAYVTNGAGGIDSLTKLLLHLDNNVTDSEITPKTVTNNNVTFDTTAGKFSYYGIFNGTNANLTLEDSADFYFGTNAFTIDFWYKPNGILDGLPFCYHQSTGYTDAWILRLSDTTDISFTRWAGGTFNISGTHGMSDGNWYHIALIRGWGGDADSWAITINGSSVATGSNAVEMPDASGLFQIGSDIGNNGKYIKGNIDEFRITKGAARWTSNFTPSASAYSLDSLQCHSEGTIKVQGSYSLKGISTTGALNKTLTRTIVSPIDLSKKSFLNFYIRASRTGSNIKIGIHDSGGTTTEITPNILSVDTFQIVSWNITSVTDANKDVIDSIIITIINADAENIFYIDNFYIANTPRLMNVS